MGVYMKLNEVLFQDKNFGSLYDSDSDGFVKYLEGDGASYIDTMWSGYRNNYGDVVGEIPEDLPSFEIEFDINNSETSHSIIGILDNGSGFTQPCLSKFLATEYKLQYSGKGATFSNVIISGEGKNVAKIGSVYSYLNNIQISDNSNMGNQYRLNALSENTLQLFGGAYTTNDGTSFDIADGLRIYSFKAYSGDKLVLNLRPYRKNGIGCMIDTLTENIYENKGTGSFITGKRIG